MANVKWNQFALSWNYSSDKILVLTYLEQIGTCIKELKYYHVFAANDFFKSTVHITSKSVKLFFFFFCFHDYWRCYRHMTGRINYLQKTKICLLKVWLHCIYFFLHCYCLYRNIYGIHVKENYMLYSVYIINWQNTIVLPVQ